MWLCLFLFGMTFYRKEELNTEKCLNNVSLEVFVDFKDGNV